MPLVSFRQEDCTGPNGVSIDGRAWSDGKGIWNVVTGDFVYDTNRIRNASVPPLLAIAYDSTLPTDLADQAILSDVTDFNLLLVRYDEGANNYYLAYVIGTACYLYRVDAGVATFLATGSWSGGRLQFEAVGSTLRILEGAVQRISVVDATYATGLCGIQITQGGEFFDNIEVFVDSSLVTTPAPTTPAPTGPPTTPAPTSNPVDQIVGLGYSVVDFTSGSFAMGTLHPDGTIWLEVGDTATDVLTDGCWDNDGNVYFAYKVGAAVRIARYDGRDSGASADWDVALVTMQSSDGRAMVDWHDDTLWVWVHNVSTAGNLPQIYRLNPETGALLDAGAWTTPSRSPSAALAVANPGGANFGIRPAIRVSDSRVWLLGGDDAKQNVYFELINLGTKAQIVNLTLQTEGGLDETYPRGMDLDPINEFCFMHWADYNDTSSRDEPNFASYDSAGSVRWTFSPVTLGFDFIGDVAYDIQNDQLYMAGGVDLFGQTFESIATYNAATGARTGGSAEPFSGAVTRQLDMYAPDDGILIVNGSTVFRYEPALIADEWATVLAASPTVMRSDYLWAAGAGGPTSFPGTTVAPTTPPPTTEPPFTGPTTLPPTTPGELTFPPATPTPGPITTPPPTTAGPTPPPTTLAPTSFPGTTEPPTLDGDEIELGLSYLAVMDQLVGRSWVKNAEEKVRDEALLVEECKLVLVDELGTRLEFQGVADELGPQYVRFVVPQARLFTNHVYVFEATLQIDGGPLIGPAVFMVPVN